MQRKHKNAYKKKRVYATDKYQQEKEMNWSIPEINTNE